MFHCKPLTVLLAALLGGVCSVLPVFAGPNVAAWGAGTIYNPGDDFDYGQSIVPPNVTNATEAAGGGEHSMALTSDGTLQGWGYDSEGQTDFPNTNTYLAVACGYYHSLALLTNGTVIAEGDDTYGQSVVPAGLTNVAAIACGFYHSLALRADGTLAAWGATNFALVQYGQAQVPNGLSNVVAIAGGAYDSLVLKSDGTIFAWGYNIDGETNIPTGLSNVVAVAMGAAHGLALKANGTVIAWGSNLYGQTNVPPGLSHVVAIAAGAYQSLAVVGSGPPLTQVAPTQSGPGTNGFSVSVPTQNGRVYQLEYKNSLTDSIWQSLPLQAGTGGRLPLTDPAAASQRFYRVLRW